jgi:uncharacterized Ntn-hydrolase superfamily protein
MDDARLARRLRTLSPARCYAIVDGERREVAIGAPGSRGRWQRVIEAARAMGADGVECVDADGAVLDVLTFDAFNDTSTHAVDTRTSARDVAGDVERIVALCMECADRAVQRHGEHVRIALDALARVCEAVADRAERLERALAAVAAARDDGGDTSQTDRLATLALTMLAGGHPGTLDARSVLTPTANGGKKGE